MPLQIDLSDYGVGSLSNLANIAGSMHGEVKPNAGIRDRAMIGDVGLNRVGGPFGSKGAEGTSGAAKYLTDPNQFSTWRPTEAAAYQNATGMRDAVLAVGKDPAAFDRLSSQMQQNMLASLAATRGVYGTGELRGISGGSTFYSVIDILSPNRTAEHEARGARSGVNVGGNTFYGNDPEMSAKVAQGIRSFDYNGAISTLANNLPQTVASPYRQFQPDLFKPQGQGFNPDSATNPGVPDASGYGIGDPNFGGNVTPAGYDTVRNPASPIADAPVPPARPSDSDLDLRSPLDKLSDSLTQGVEGAGRAVVDVAGQVGGLISGLLPGATPPQPAPGAYDFGSGTNVSGGVQPGLMNPGLVPGDTSFAGGFDPSAYLAANPDVAQDAGFANNPLQHLIQYGFQENRALDTQGRRFDAELYAAQNPDVVAAGLIPAQHYAEYGRNEGRAAPIIGPDGTVQNVGNFASTFVPGAPATTSTVNAPQTTPTIGAPQASPTIGAGPAFDAAAYLRNNADVAAFGMNPLEHLLRYGGQEGRIIDDNGDRFDAATYLRDNPDVAAAGLDATQHYAQYGEREGRLAPIIGPDGTVRTVGSLGLASQVTPEILARLIQPETAQTIGPPDAENAQQFDPEDYLAANADVRAAGLNPWDHYQRYGLAEGRAANAEGLRIDQAFDPAQYLAQNQDVAAAQLDPLQHLLKYGVSEGRQVPTGANPYAFTNANVAQGAGETGQGTFSGTFDPNAYLAANPDVAQANMNPMQHYLQYGFSEGRAIDPQGHAVAKNFDPTAYLSANQDVARSNLNPLQHLLQYGAAEGRQIPTGSNPYAFSNYNVSQALGATPQSFDSFYGSGGGATTNLGLDVAPPSGTIGDFGFSGANVGGFDVNAAGGAPSGAADNPSTAGGLNWDPQAAQNAYLDSQVSAANASNAAMDAFNPAMRSGMFTSSTGNPNISRAVADYNVETLNAANRSIAQSVNRPIATPVTMPKSIIATRGFAGRW